MPYVKAAAEVNDYNGSGGRKVNVAELAAGTVIDELQVGEDIKFNGGQGTPVSFGPFEQAIMQGIAWSHEIPPEIYNARIQQ